MSLQERMRIICAKNFDGNQSDFAKLIDVPPQTLGNWLNGTSMIKYDGLLKILKNTRFNANWLILGEGPMYREQDDDAMDIFTRAAADPESPVVAMLLQAINRLEKKIDTLTKDKSGGD